MLVTPLSDVVRHRLEQCAALPSETTRRVSQVRSETTALFPELVTHIAPYGGEPPCPVCGAPQSTGGVLALVEARPHVCTDRGTALTVWQEISDHLLPMTYEINEQDVVLFVPTQDPTRPHPHRHGRFKMTWVRGGSAELLMIPGAPARAAHSGAQASIRPCGGGSEGAQASIRPDGGWGRRVRPRLPGSGHLYELETACAHRGG